MLNKYLLQTTQKTFNLAKYFIFFSILSYFFSSSTAISYNGYNRYNSNSGYGYNQPVYQGPAYQAPAYQDPYIPISTYNNYGYRRYETEQNINWWYGFLTAQIIIEPHIFLHYSVIKTWYNNIGGLDYNTCFNNVLPVTFGGAIGVKINEVILLEYGIFGTQDNKTFMYNGSTYQQKTDFIAMRFNTGIAIPLTHGFLSRYYYNIRSVQVNLLFLAGFVFDIRNVSYSSNPPTQLTPLGTTVGILPELGGGIEYSLGRRTAIRTNFRYAFNGNDPLLREMFTFDFGIQIKL